MAGRRTRLPFGARRAAGGAAAGLSAAPDVSSCCSAVGLASCSTSRRSRSCSSVSLASAASPPGPAAASPSSPARADEKFSGPAGTHAVRGAKSVEKMMRSRSSPWIWSMDWMKSIASAAVACSAGRRHAWSARGSRPSEALHASTMVWISERCGRRKLAQVGGQLPERNRRLLRVDKALRRARVAWHDSRAVAKRQGAQHRADLVLCHGGVV
eukprot:scaffold1182_cov124-Isochrysis_galbana.AAC.6